MNSTLLRTLRTERARLERALADCPPDSKRYPSLSARIARLTDSIQQEINRPAGS